MSSTNVHQQSHRSNNGDASTILKLVSLSAITMLLAVKMDPSSFSMSYSLEVSDSVAPNSTVSFNNHQTIMTTTKTSNNYNESSKSKNSSLSIDTVPPSSKYAQKEFWRYDEAAPDIQQGKTHVLSSIPEEYRVRLELEDNKETMENSTMNLSEAFSKYALNPNKTFPKKLHLVEMNPSIAKLPKSYQRNEEWSRAFGSDDGGNKSNAIPYYISTYRVTELHNCFNTEHTKSIRYGGDWEAWRKDMPITDYLGIALLDAKLDVLADITVTMLGGVFGPYYQDYRVFNLRGNSAGEEQLYLSTFELIVPMQLSLLHPNKEKEDVPPDGFIALRPAFSPSTSSTTRPSFQASVRSTRSCTQKPRDYAGGIGGIKNILYFDETRTKKNGINATSATIETRVVFYPKTNPQHVYPVNLDHKCNRTRREMPSYMNTKSPYPDPSFKTMDREIYPNRDDLFVNDRGSACCIRVKRDQIPFAASPSMAAYLYNVTSHDKNNDDDDDDDDDTLLVAIVHPKTKFPGKKLPKGVAPNIYLSRFIAFLPKEPYTIVARSGMFCLGFPNVKEILGKSGLVDSNQFYNYLVEENPLRFGNEVLFSCPKIHFVLSMIEKPTNQEDDQETDSVIISYGVQDCLPRFVEIKKSDIIGTFHGQ